MLYQRDHTGFWWIRFKFKGRLIQQSSKVTNIQEARTIEASLKTALARGEVGIFEKKTAPTLAQFIDADYLPHVKHKHAAKPRTTLRSDLYHAARLKATRLLAEIPMDKITAKLIDAHAATQLAEGLAVNTVNLDLRHLRRMFKLAMKWGKVTTVLPEVSELKGGNRRERVVTAAEEKKYLAAAEPLLKDVATLLFDLGLRPEECHRLQRENVRDDAVEIFKGKGRGSRRRIPCSERVTEILNRRLADSKATWVFPAPTKAGHINTDSLKKQHDKAITDSGVTRFVPYDIRHTCITRWSRKVDAFTLHHLAGHKNMATTLRYVHQDEATLRKILEVA
jgi:integrase